MKDTKQPAKAKTKLRGSQSVRIKVFLHGGASGEVKAMVEWLVGLMGVWALLFAAHVARADSYYVSGASGNDAWSGLLPAPNATHTDGPFQTLAKAQSAMRGSSTNKTTTIRAGTYSIAGTTFAFTSVDNGETWIPYAGEKVILDGGGTGFLSAQQVTNLTIEGLTFQNLAGGTGPGGDLLIRGGSGYTIRWNTFLNCKGFCVHGRNVQSSLFDSNTFNGQSPGMIPTRRIAYKVLDFGAGSSNNKVSHNLIENAEGGGIDFERGPSDPPQRNNLIDRNILQKVNTNDRDMGALYAFDPDAQSTGLQITNNLVFGNLGTDPTSDLIKAFYLDDGVSGALVKCNICNQCGEWAVQIHGGANNVITNNVFDLTPPSHLLGIYQHVGMTKMAGNTFTNNIIYSASIFPKALWNQYGSPPTPLAVNANLYYSAAGASIPNGGPIVDANPKNRNPGFANPANNSYALPSNSPASSLINWQPCPTDQGPLPNPFVSSQPSTPNTSSNPRALP